MFERIDRLVTKNGFTLKAWDDRYCKGVWVVCTHNQYQADEIQQASEAGDLDMIPATEYVLSTEWLPVVTGRTLVTAVAALEARLAPLDEGDLARESPWGSAVWDALEHLRDVRRDATEYGGSDGRFQVLPETLQALRASLAASAAPST